MTLTIPCGKNRLRRMEKDGLILTKSEYDNLLEEIYRLRLRITELTALRDDLRYHVCPALKAEYEV